MKFRPLQDRVLVKQLEAREKSEGGIIIPDDAKKKPTRGEIVAVGPGRALDDGSLRKVELKVGDQVLFGDYSGDDIEIDRVKYKIMREEDVLGVVEDAG
jgi:chaperonin GroES